MLIYLIFLLVVLYFIFNKNSLIKENYCPMSAQLCEYDCPRAFWETHLASRMQQRLNGFY